MVSEIYIARFGTHCRITELFKALFQLKHKSEAGHIVNVCVLRLFRVNMNGELSFSYLIRCFCSVKREDRGGAECADEGYARGFSVAEGFCGIDVGFAFMDVPVLPVLDDIHIVVRRGAPCRIAGGRGEDVFSVVRRKGNYRGCRKIDLYRQSVAPESCVSSIAQKRSDCA